MDKIKKHIKRLTRRKRDLVELCITDILARQFGGYNLKKLRGHHFLYRIRIEDQRIIFYMDNTVVLIKDIDTRNDNTYKNL